MLLAFIVIVVLLLIAAYALSRNGIYPDQLGGFWKADPNFLIDSGLVTMIMYVGGGFKKRDVVLYAANANGVILNNATQCDFGFYGNKRRITFGVNHAWFPAKQIMHLDLAKRCMILTTESGKVTAKLYYDHCLSDTEDAMVKKINSEVDESMEDIESDDGSDNESNDKSNDERADGLTVEETDEFD